MKTTFKHFEYFRKCVHDYVTRMGLLRWHIHCKHESDSDYPDALALCTSEISARSAVFNLVPDWGSYTITNKRLERAALHESVHLLTARMTAMVEGAMNGMHISQREIDEEAEAIVRGIEHLVLGMEE